MSNSPNGFDADPKRASEAGKKSKKKGIDARVREFLEEAYKEGTDKTREELILDALLKFGLKGNVKALEILMDRGHGKPKQSTDVSGTLETKTIIMTPDEKEAFDKLNGK
jgi:hypothetical protein